MAKTTMAAEIKEKIIQMRLDGVTWKEINEKLNLAQNAHHSIYKAPWFIKGMTAAKEKRRQKEKEKKKEEKKESGQPTDEGKEKKRKAVDKEIEKHIKGSDKAPANIKKKEVVGSGKTGTEEIKEEKKEKSSFGLWAILIIALVIGVVVIIFLLKGKKAENKEPEEQNPKSRGFEGRSEEDI
ncbi:hypothetical protein KAV79_07480 [Candidatus Aerophobetes bacterium]|nr:hypothetical protein [Candidatus Aerophobetes bacterium]